MFNGRMIMNDKLMRTGKEFEFPMLNYGLLYHCLLDIKTFISLEILKFPDPYMNRDRLCGLVVRVLGYRSGGPGSIPGITRKKSSGSGTGCTQPREYN
jgi:hypothetical protein